MNCFTLPFRLFIKKSSFFFGLLFLSVPLFSHENASPPILLQCPTDVVVGPFAGDCGFYLDYSTLTWSSDVTVVNSSFSPGPGYFFPIGTTPVTLTVTDSFGVIEMCTFNVTLLSPSNSLVCNDNIVVEFDGECTREIKPFEILEGGPYACEEWYSVSILSNVGADLGNLVGTGFIGNTYTISVSNVEGYVCWGTLVVQSNGMPQMMTCPADVTILCHEPYDTVGLPLIDGCFSAEDYTHTYFDVKTNSFCDGDNIAFTVNRQWTSADPMGNQTTCTQLISARRISFSDIDFPLNLDGVERPKLGCSNLANLAIDADTSITGIPLVNGLDPTTVACNLTFIITDSVDNTCGNHFIIKRKWKAYDYCLDQFFAHTQLIILADEEGPVFSVPDTILFSTNNNCSGTVLLPRINLVNECSGYDVMIETPWNTFHTDSVFAGISSVPGFYDIFYTATDFCGNISIDTIIVQVSADLLAQCLDDVNITADYYLENLKTGLDADDYSVLDGFGSPEFFANCIFDPTQLVQVNLDACNEGTIFREHTVELNGMPIHCSQTIHVNHVSDFVVKFPIDIIAECVQGQPDFGVPEIFFVTCELLAVTYEDEIFTNVADACLKIVRTWSVINWCVAGAAFDNEVIEESELQLRQSGCLDFPFSINSCDLNNDGICDDYTYRDSWSSCDLPDDLDANKTSGPDTDIDSDPWDGYISYQQVIKLIDTIDPVFTSGCDMPDVCINSNSCSLDLLLPTPEVEDCYLDPTIFYSIRIGSIWKNGIGPYPNVTPGDYPVRYVAADNCNNQTACETTLKVVDCTPPTVTCKDMLEVSLSPNGVNDPMIVLFANEMINSSYDNCIGNLEFSFSPIPNDNNRTYTCDDLGLHSVQIWSTDKAGNQSNCTAYFSIFADGINVVCEDSPADFGGNIDNEYGIGIANVIVDNSLNYPAQTNAFGNYSLYNSQMFYPFSVSPEKNDNHTNGVTTYDIVLLTRHILGVSLLDNPYKIIAADANRSNTVTTFDAVEIRKLILGINSEFPSNTSWRFVTDDYQFNNPNDPFSPPLPDSFWVNGSNVNSMDFIGIKIGDLNGSANVNFDDSIGNRNLIDDVFLKANDELLKNVQTIEVPFFMKDQDIIGFQTTVEFDTDKLRLLEMKSGSLSMQHFGKKKLSMGRINVSYDQFDPIVFNKEIPLFTLVFNTKNAGHLAEWISIDKEGIPSEAYSKEMGIHGLGLYFEKPTHPENILFVYPLQPNPFSDKSTLPFYLPEGSMIKCTFFTPNGKVLNSVVSNFPAGYSNLEIAATELKEKGLIFYRFETEHGSTMGKLVIFD